MIKSTFILSVIVIILVIQTYEGQHKAFAHGQLLSSTTKFSEFANLDFAAGLKKYLQHETKRLDVIKKSKGYEEEVPVVKTRLELLQLLSKQLNARKAEYDLLRQRRSDFHPTSALRLISDFLDTYEDKLKNDTYGFRFADFLSNNDDSKLPKQSDLKHIVQAVAEIQFVYNLSTSDIYMGKILGHQGTPLRPQDAYQIGLKSWEMLHLKQAESWLETALNNTPKAEMNAKKVKEAPYDVADAMAKLGVLKYGMDEKQKGLELLENAADLDPDSEEILRLFLSHRFGRDVAPLVHSDPGAFKLHWFQLCANKSSATVAPVKWYHVCRYRRSSRVPYRVYKEQILSRSPFLSVVDQFVTVKEANKLINITTRKMKDFPVDGALSDQYLIQGSSSSNKVSVAGLISDRITDLTGMDTSERPLHSSGEPIHVFNYGISGTFLPHYDIGRQYDYQHIMRESGYRMATMLIYLSDVKAGGATVFPHLNLTVTPETGKALLWYNVNPNGDVPRETLHAGCTVAVGSKWAASKGIWSWGNELRRPCGRTSRSSHLAVDKITSKLPAATKTKS